MNPLIQSKNATILPVLITLMLGCFGLSPQAGAVDPPPDGGYPRQNTAEGEDALLNLNTGRVQHGDWLSRIDQNAQGQRNTAVGSNALQTLSAAISTRRSVLRPSPTPHTRTPTPRSALLRSAEPQPATATQQWAICALG